MDWHFTCIHFDVWNIFFLNWTYMCAHTHTYMKPKWALAVRWRQSSSLHLLSSHFGLSVCIWQKPFSGAYIFFSRNCAGMVFPFYMYSNTNIHMWRKSPFKIESWHFPLNLSQKEINIVVEYSIWYLNRYYKHKNVMYTFQPHRTEQSHHPLWKFCGWPWSFCEVNGMTMSGLSVLILAKVCF